MAKPLHAFAVKDAAADPSRGYGEHPYITWPRQPAIVRLPYWSTRGGPVTVTVKDANGSVWKELAATAEPGMNEIEYDLTVDARRADAAETVARGKAMAEKADREKAERAKARKGGARQEEAPAKDPDEEDEEPAEKAGSASGGPALDAELQRLLADPLRSTRRRYLPEGRYTLEFRSGTASATSSLRVKAKKETAASTDDDEDVSDNP
jgi:hypothetical protein